MAIGDGNVAGVNQRLKAFLTGPFGRSRSRLGVVLMDWYHSVDGLVDAILALQ